MENNNILKESYNGLLIVKAKNANFNAGFDGNPRTLPNGRIFATDKALKYCLREYFSLFKDNMAFVRRNRKLVLNGEKYQYTYELLSQNFISKLKYLVEREKPFETVPEGILNEEDKDQILKFYKKNKEGLDKMLKNQKSKEVDKEFKKLLKDDKLQINILRSFLDVRLFGVVFAVSGNISITGPVQISYGVNKFDKTNIFAIDILSPYKNPNADKNKKKKDENKIDNEEIKEEKIINQTTIGDESRADEVYYVYNISVNVNNARNSKMTEGDLGLLKEGLLNSVDVISSTTKFGCEAVSLIWFKNKENKILNNLDDFISIKERDKKIILNYHKLKEFLGEEFEEIEYNDYKIENEKVQVIYKKNKIYVEDKKEQY
jgi:CRISPR-associated protein Csh2